MEITDLRDSTRVAQGRFIDAQLCANKSMRIITDTGYQIYISPADIELIDSKYSSLT